MTFDFWPERCTACVTEAGGVASVSSNPWGKILC